MANTLPQTQSRVVENTPQEIIMKLRRQLEARVYYYAENPQLIDERMAELDKEWDIERVLETNASAVSLVGMILARRSRKWLLLPFAVSAFLMQHALQGWCPPVEIFRRMGVRTAGEINDERTALRTLRGDFDKTDVSAVKEARTKAGKALDAINY